MARMLAVCPVLRNWDIWQIENGTCALTLTLAGGLGGGLFTAVLESEHSRTVVRRILPPGRLRLPDGAGSTAVSGRGWGVLLHQGEGIRTVTAKIEGFQGVEALEVHAALTGEGPMGVFRVSGTVELGEGTWDFPLSRSTARLVRVRGGRERA